MTQPRTKRVLVADAPAGVEMLRNLLENRAVVLGTNDLDEGLAIMRQGVNLTVCGLHFDESRMFDLLRLAKADAATRDIPFVCFRNMDSELKTPLLQSVEIACMSLGAIRFVDLHQLRRRDEQVEESFRRMLLELLDSD